MVRATFVMEQQVGHKTFYQNLRRFVDADQQIQASWSLVTYHEPGGLWERMRFLPAGLRGTLRGRSQVRRALSRSDADVFLFFTQVPAALGGQLTRRRPYVLVTDITPVQYDQMAEHYGHQPDRAGPLKAYKHRLNAAMLRRAARILPFSQWVRNSLIRDYGVDPQRIEVIPPGVDIERWRPGPKQHGGPLRILFVGGEFARKGGETLLAAFRALPRGTAELHVVTRTELTREEGVFPHYGMQPNAPELIELYRSADVFVLPSLAEAFGHVVVEAGASGLPAIVSNVGGMPEIIAEGETGYVINPGDSAALRGHLERLAADAGLRERMSRAARQRVETRFNGQLNAARTIECLRAAAGEAGVVAAPRAASR